MLVKHASADLGPLLRPLGFEPDNNKVAGQRRVTPVGRLLAGVYRENFWNFRHLVEGCRDFMASVSQLTTALMPHRNLLTKIYFDGGKVSITLALPNFVNIGSALDFESMARLVDLKASLDIEVFPDRDNFRS